DPHRPALAERRLDLAAVADLLDGDRLRLHAAERRSKASRLRSGEPAGGVARSSRRRSASRSEPCRAFFSIWASTAASWRLRLTGAVWLVIGSSFRWWSGRVARRQRLVESVDVE